MFLVLLKILGDQEPELIFSHLTYFLQNNRLEMLGHSQHKFFNAKVKIRVLLMKIQKNLKIVIQDVILFHT